MTVLALLAACAVDEPSPASRLILERFPCLGICPSYRLVVSADGSVVHEGIGYFNTVEAGSDRSEDRRFRRDTTRIAPADVAKLMVAFDRAWSRWLPNQYVPWRRTCPGAPTDAAGLAIVRERQYGSDTLRVYYLCLLAPARIDRLGAYIDSVAGTKRWLGPPP